MERILILLDGNNVLSKLKDNLMELMFVIALQVGLEDYVNGTETKVYINMLESCSLNHTQVIRCLYGMVDVEQELQHLIYILEKGIL